MVAERAKRDWSVNVDSTRKRSARRRLIPTSGPPNKAAPLDPVASRDLSEQLPNEALREEFANMTPEEEEEFLFRLAELARTYLGPGGP